MAAQVHSWAHPKKIRLIWNKPSPPAGRSKLIVGHLLPLPVRPTEDDQGLKLYQNRSMEIRRTNSSKIRPLGIALCLCFSSQWNIVIWGDCTQKILFSILLKGRWATPTGKTLVVIFSTAFKRTSSRVYNLVSKPCCSLLSLSCCLMFKAMRREQNFPGLFLPLKRFLTWALRKVIDLRLYEGFDIQLAWQNNFDSIAIFYF